MAKIALLPGGFKPPHAGHYNVAKWLVDNTDADMVLVRVGAKERDGITREMSLKLWDLYTKNDNKIVVRPSVANSPVRDVYDFIENEAPEGSTIYLGLGEKDREDRRFDNIGKFAEPKNISFQTILVPPQAGGVSGTQMRSFIKNNDKESFEKYIPDNINKDEAWNIVTNLDEDLYNPEDKVLDYMRSSEFKAGMPDGHKDDIPRAYKYKRGGMYTGGGMGGGMYERMYGMMTNKEKIKHSKNLKRLKKDLRKQGDQYMKVPDYLIGTLTRKYYERVGERKLTKGELKDKERIFKDLKKNKADFKKRYGKDAEAVMYATATARAKKEGIEERFSQAIIKKYKNKPQSEIPFSVRNYLKAKGIIKSKKEGMYPPYNARQVQYTRYRASDVFTRDPKKAKKLGYLEEIGIDLSNYSGQILPGDVLRAPKGFPLGGKKLEKSISLKVIKNSREGVNRYKLSLEDKDGKKYTVRNFQMDGEYKGKKLPKWGLIRKGKNENIDPKAQAKHKGKSAPYGSAYEPVKEGRKKKRDPKVGTGKKPKGSGRRLYTDENPSDTVKVKFSTRQDIVDTLSKASFKSKPHKRQSQIINLIHQRVRAALSKAKDPAVKKRLRSGFEYIKKRKEASKRKTQRMKKESLFSKSWWKNIINEILLNEGGAAGHMAHPFNLTNVNNGKDLLDIFEKSAESLDKNPGSVKIDGVNASIRLVDIDGKKQFVMDRGSKKELDRKGITKNDLVDRFGKGHGMVKVGGEVLDMFNEALPALENDLRKIGAYDDPNILFNMEYVSGKTNVQDYGSNFIAIHGLNKIESKEVQGKRGPLERRVSSEVSYDKNVLNSLLNNLEPIAKKRGYEVYGSVPTELKKKPNFGSALSKNYTINAGENSETKSLKQLLDSLDNIPEEEFIFMNVGYKTGSSTINRKKVGAVSKQVYLAILNGENVDGLFEDEEDRKKAIQGFVTYLATEKLGDEVLKVLDSPMGSVDKHEGVVIRDNNIANVPFKITGKFILGGLASDF